MYVLLGFGGRSEDQNVNKTWAVRVVLIMFPIDMKSLLGNGIQGHSWYTLTKNPH